MQTMIFSVTEREISRKKSLHGERKSTKERKKKTAQCRHYEERNALTRKTS